MATCAKFHIGQIIRHKLLNYRGIILDVDPCFQSDDALYELLALDEFSIPIANEF